MPEPAAENGATIDTEPKATIDFEAWVCPMPLRDSPNIVMGHGGGGA
ncbi:MAG: hydrogenase expression/formation protein HypE, partial [Mycobacterium sp.]|nr:hydrogenase expression/formation protein HypE [Mycobacterium sp.]